MEEEQEKKRKKIHTVKHGFSLIGKNTSKCGTSESKETCMKNHDSSLKKTGPPSLSDMIFNLFLSH